MALKLERFVCPGKGNGLRANQRVLAGELLYTAEPLACCVSSQCRNVVCHSCFSRHETLLRCSQCKVARYCDVTCQKRAWSIHKRECKCLLSLHPRIPTDSVRLAARIIFRLLCPSQMTPQLYSFEEHESHLCDMGEEKREGLSQLSSMLQLYLKQEQPDIIQKVPSFDPISLLAKVTCNCFTISDAELQEIGVGLYPSMSLLNHDCRPSCVMLFQGKTLQLRAIRDIQPTEEVTISYIGVLLPTRERQTQLMEQYHFSCQCGLCSTAELDPLMFCGVKEAWTPMKEAIPRLEILQTNGNWEELLQECSSLLAPVGGAVPAVPDSNVYRLRVTDLAFDACINLARWETALAYGLKTLGPYRQYYPDPHPAHAIQLMRVAKLQHFLVHLEDAQHTLRLAYDIMKITHGNEHSLTSDLIRKLEECLAEMDCK
ncbi:histone-lysine N-methyltransferase SMYD3 [Esox lucius]|uniref:[histone H3]-lysine(4) N-trimethyltransferase n=1 Tax=Esox lucius TaxID=8010 RepID=C1BWL4_ESOLU|nr:histone-lysine N-methyltransferase SMYD3 [Esox lucius]ACO13417.1 SET and MYND domain-containing protein 3 [Esox lucius]